MLAPLYFFVSLVEKSEITFLYFLKILSQSLNCSSAFTLVELAPEYSLFNFTLKVSGDDFASLMINRVLMVFC